MSNWKPANTAPANTRILVGGWQEPSRNGVRGYFWYHEDDTDENGVIQHHPFAQLWHPWPEFPKSREEVQRLADATKTHPTPQTAIGERQ